MRAQAARTGQPLRRRARPGARNTDGPLAAEPARVLQAYRALREEQVLLAVLPGYRSYRARTAALLPGVF